MPVIDRLLMKHLPDYHLVDERQRECYSQLYNNDSSFRFKIVRDLINSLFDKNLKTETEIDNFFELLGPKDRYLVSQELLKIRGIGKDSLMINNLDPSGEEIHNMHTLYDYDYKKFCFQVDAFRKYGSNRSYDDYVIDLGSTWCQLQYEGYMAYGFLNDLAFYVYSKVEEVAMDYIETLIPYWFKNNGTCLSVDAQGHEFQLLELEKRILRGYLVNLYDDLKERFSQSDEPLVYMFDQYDHYGLPTVTFIYDNEETLKHIRLRNIVEDSKKYQKPYNDLLNIINNEVYKCKNEILKEYNLIKGY